MHSSTLPLSRQERTTLSSISAYYHYFHNLLTAPTNAPSPIYCFTNIKGGPEHESEWWSLEVLPICYSTGILK